MQRRVDETHQTVARIPRLTTGLRFTQLLGRIFELAWVKCENKFVTRLTLTGVAISLLGPLATCIHLVVVCREIRAVLLNIAVTWEGKGKEYDCTAEIG